MDAAIKPDKIGVKAVDTALSVLETVAFSSKPLGVTQLAAAVGLTKSAIFRHLVTLVERGFLVQDESSRYELGPKAFLIGRLAPATSDIVSIARDSMRIARDLTGLAVVISAPSSQGVFVLETLHGTMAIEIGVRPGSYLPYYSSAQGKVFLAFGSKDLMESIRPPDLRKLTPHTIVDMERLRKELARVRAQGYAVAPEEALLGVNTLAAPVFNHENKLVAAVAFVGSIQHVPAKPSDEQIAAIRELSGAVSRKLGSGMARRT